MKFKVGEVVRRVDPELNGIQMTVNVVKPLRSGCVWFELDGEGWTGPYEGEFGDDELEGVPADEVRS